MELPKLLQLAGETKIQLGGVETVRLPICRPTFSLWKGVPAGFDFGSKPVLEYKGESYFAELIILNLLLEDGWEGVWVETYGGTHYLRSMPKEGNLKCEHT